MGRSIDVAGIGHNAPIPLGARVGDLLCSSGISGKDAATGTLPADPLRQAALAFANLEALLKAGGATLGDVAKLTIYVKDTKDTQANNSLHDAINTEWQRCFPDPKDRPARHILTYELQHGMALQLECMALIRNDLPPSST
jgi:2-iminobutanoate/2-iminopropanoate deaminase